MSSRVADPFSPRRFKVWSDSRRVHLPATNEDGFPRTVRKLAFNKVSAHALSKVCTVERLIWAFLPTTKVSNFLASGKVDVNESPMKLRLWICISLSFLQFLIIKLIFWASMPALPVMIARSRVQLERLRWAFKDLWVISFLTSVVSKIVHSLCDDSSSLFQPFETARQTLVMVVSEIARSI